MFDFCSQKLIAYTIIFQRKTNMFLPYYFFPTGFAAGFAA
jgi:hypothetical protein